MTKRSPAAYADVIEILDKAVATGSLRYRCRTYGLAINFRQRCYGYRALAYQLANEQLGEVPGLRATTPYDGLEIIIQDSLGGTISRKGSPSPYFDVLIQYRASKGFIVEDDDV